MLVLSAETEEIPLERAEQSSIYGSSAADRAIDNDASTKAITNRESNPWLKIYFKSSADVEKVMIEKGYSYNLSCVFTVSVYKGEVKKLCGTYHNKPGYYNNEAAQCGGERGDSVVVEVTECGKHEHLYIHELKVYGQGTLEHLVVTDNISLTTFTSFLQAEYKIFCKLFLMTILRRFYFSNL